MTAALELVGERSYAELSVGAVMERAGLERTLFYRHFDDLGDLLLRAAGEAIEELWAAQVDLGAGRDGSGTHPEKIREAMRPPVALYERHGPLLRVLDEGAASDARIAAGRGAMRERFDELAADSLGELPQLASLSPAELRELARALNLLNTAYLLDAFGREPRIDAETALATLTTIWTGVIYGPRPEPASG